MPTLDKLDKYSPMLVGVLQAAAIAVYILTFASLITQIGQPSPRIPEFAAASFFLLAFVFSALVCGSLALGYPALLAVRGKVSRAVKIVAWSALTFAVILLLAIVVLVSFR
jgi:hypothetical protein